MIFSVSLDIQGAGSCQTSNGESKTPNASKKES